VDLDRLDSYSDVRHFPGAEWIRHYDCRCMCLWKLNRVELIAEARQEDEQEGDGCPTLAIY